MKKGLFITFEGIDGSGKTTQVKEFIRRLEIASIPFLLFREPGGTEIGEKVRRILLDKSNTGMLPITELLLYSASRYQLTCQSIIPALESGKVVICDRFYDSTTAYQGYARCIDLSFIERLNSVATESLVPDLTFILDISLLEREERIGNKDLDRLEQEDIKFQERVREGFIAIAKKEPERAIIIDGSRASAKISDEIWGYFIKIRKGEYNDEIL